MERLRRMREDGLTVAKIVQASDGCITESSVMDILECKRVPIAVYRVLATALDRIET